MSNDVTVKENTNLSNSEKFTNKVLREFGSNVAGALQVTDYQRQLIQGYFIQIDRALKSAEERRIRDNGWKKEKNEDPISWLTVDLNKLALDVVHYARIGLDMMQDNHLYAIPYKDNGRRCESGTKMYIVNLMPGYNGIQYIAEKYALDKPESVTIELVYSTDTFKPIKKNRENKVESYEFEINNAFDRGEVVGGFGYIEYADDLKNKLIIMTKKDIEKRKPEYASAEFWGGIKKEKKDGKYQDEEIEGWYEEMCLKTIKREVYSAKNMPRDPKKIDDNYQYMKMQEFRLAQMQVADVVEEKTASVPIDISTPEIEDKRNIPDADTASMEKKPAQVQMTEETGGQMAMPGF